MENISSLLDGMKDIDKGRKLISNVESDIANIIENSKNEDKRTKKAKDRKKVIDEFKSQIASSQIWIQSREKIMVDAKKELFSVIEKDRIPEEKIPAINAFFFEYQKSSDNEIQDPFDTIDIDKFPAEKVPTAICFLADYLESSYKKTMFEEINEVHFKDYVRKTNFIESTNMNSSLNEAHFFSRNLHLSSRIFHVLTQNNIRTIGELVAFYKANPKKLFDHPNFGKGSDEGLTNFLNERHLI